VSAKHAETHSAVGAVGAGSHTRSGAEQRARTTVVVALGAAQNGTSALCLSRGLVGQPDFRLW
jgi:hypothetical protein